MKIQYEIDDMVLAPGLGQVWITRITRWVLTVRNEQGEVFTVYKKNVQPAYITLAGAKIS